MSRRFIVVDLGAQLESGQDAALEPLPCPLCGRIPQELDRASDHTTTGRFHAFSCFDGGYSTHVYASGETREVALAKWNRRVPMPQDAAVIAARRFAVWDREVERFWKINNHQTWLSIKDLVADFRAKDRPEPRFKDAFKDQEDEITYLATIAGFDLDE